MSHTILLRKDWPEFYLMSHISGNKIAFAQKNGSIRLCEYRNKNFETLGIFYGAKEDIRCIIPYLPKYFVSVASTGTVQVWDINAKTCWKTFEKFDFYSVDKAVTLSNDLLVIAGNVTMAWGSFSVYDLLTGKCIHDGQLYTHRPHGMALAVMPNGQLVATTYCRGEMKIYQIDRTECRIVSDGEIHRIYSMAVMPNGFIATGHHHLDIYRISGEKITLHKTIEGRNVKDDIFPYDGDKLLAIDRSTMVNVKDWDCEKETAYSVGHIADPWHCIFLEKEGIILIANESSIAALSTECKFPPRYAEARKNARILYQGFNSESSPFAILPEEIILKIIVLASGDLTENQETLCRQIAETHFSKP